MIKRDHETRCPFLTGPPVAMVIASLDLRIGTPRGMPLLIIDELNGSKVKFNFLAGCGKMQQNEEKASFRG